MEYTGLTEWKLTKEMVELELGHEINEEEFILFCNHFEVNFQAQIEDTFQWQASDWEEVKEWDL